MSDPTSPAATGRTRGHVSEEIGRSVSSIWQRRQGARPVTVSTEYVGDVVRCVIERVAAPERTADEAPGESTESHAYRNEVQATVARLTKRSVRGYIAKRDAKTGEATDTFIFDPIQIKY